MVGFQNFVPHSLGSYERNGLVKCMITPNNSGDKGSEESGVSKGWGMLHVLEKRQGIMPGVIELVRVGIFLSVYILSFRFVFICLTHAPVKSLFILLPLLLAMALLIFLKTEYIIYGFLVAIPFVSGLQIIGFFRPLPLLSLMFATLYVVWMPRRLFLKRGNFAKDKDRAFIGHSGGDHFDFAHQQLLVISN